MIKRSIPTLAYVGSLIRAIREIDKDSLHRTDFIRIKIAVKDVSKVPEVVEGAILPFLYDFYFEREMEWGVPTEKVAIKVGSGRGDFKQPSPKKPRTENKESGTTSLQIEVCSSKAKDDEIKQMKQQIKELPQIVDCSDDEHQKLSKGGPAPTKLLSNPLDKILEMEEQSFQLSPSGKQATFDSLLEMRDDRVQGLSGNAIGMSEEDLPSGEGQGSQSNRHITGLVKCVLLDTHKKEKNVLSYINPVEDALGKSFRVLEVPDSVENDAISDTSKVEFEKGGGGVLGEDL
jgi:hypothetical protein